MWGLKKTVNVYTDGSYSNSQVKWAFCVIENESVIHKASGIIDDPRIKEGYQVGGECLAVIKALEWCCRHNYRGLIHYDFIGLSKWVNDLTGGKPWKTNRFYTKDYREKVLLYKDYLAGFVKIKGHSGNKWNDYVDGLASEAQ